MEAKPEVSRLFSFHDIKELKTEYSDFEPLNQLKLAQSRDFRPFFERMMSWREKGCHTEAIRLLTKEKQSLSSELRFLLLARFYYELADKKAFSYLAQAKDKGLSEAVFQLENFFFRLTPQNFSTAEEDYRPLAEIVFPEESGKKPLSVQIAAGLLLRRNYELCVSWLEYQLKKEAYPPEIDRIFKKLVSGTFQDIYYRYYGWPILFFQILATALVLSIAAYHFQYLGEPCLALIRNMVSGISNWPAFWHNLQRVLPPIFLFIALSPVLFINSLMLFFRFRGRIDCYTEVHDNYIKVCDFGFVYHLAIKERGRYIYLYEDDNDYTYISLIRLLPFIPNLTYIYAWDYLRGFYCLVPLYGVADGTLFRRNYLHSSTCSIYNFNMFGVRLAQLATVLHKTSHSYLGAIPLIVGGTVFIFGNIYYMTEASAFIYFAVFGSFLLLLLLFFQFTRLCLFLFELPLMCRFWRMNIVRSGIMFLAIWYFIGHYQVYGFFGIIPILLCSYGFYLLFVLTKYDHAEKQIVAEASAFGHVPFHTADCYLHHNLRMVSQPDKKGFFSRSPAVFYNDDYIAIPFNFCGLTIYYDVINRNRPQKAVKLYDADSVLKLSTLVERQIKLPVWRLCIVLFCWLGWQYAWQMPQNDRFVQTKTEPSLFFSCLQKTQPFRKDERGLYNKLEKIYWEKVTGTEQAICFQQEELPSWGGLENTLVQNVLAGLWPKIDHDIPYFLRKDGFRDDIFNFFYWYAFLHWQTADVWRYANSYQAYCRNLGLGLHLVDEEPRCYFQVGFADISVYAAENKVLPDFIAAEELFDIFVHNGLLLEFATKEQQDNFELLATALAQNGNALKFASEQWQNNLDLVRIALKSNSAAFNYVGAELRQSEFWQDLWTQPDFVLSAIKSDAGAFNLASPTLKQDEDFILESVNINPAVAKFMSQARVEKPFWQKMIHQNKETASFLPLSYQQDKNFMWNLVRTQPSILVYFSDLQNDQDFLLTAFKSNLEIIYWANEHLKKDVDFMFRCLAISPFAFIYADRSLRFHRTFIIAAMNAGFDIFPLLPRMFFADPDIAFLSVSFNQPHYFSFISPQLVHNPDFLVKALIKNPALYHVLPDDIENISDILLSALNVNPDLLQLLEDDYLQDSNFIMQVLTRNGLALQYARPEMRSDRGLVLTAVRNRVEAFRFAAPHLQADSRFVLEAMRNGGVDGWKAFEYAAGALRSYPDFVLAAISQNAWVVRHVSPRLLADKNIVRAALERDGLTMQIMSDEVRATRELAMIAVRQNGWAIAYLDKQLASDTQIKAVACQTTPLMNICR